MTTYIYYNGIGAHKSGKHTVKNFLRRIGRDSISKNLCSNMLKMKTLPACKKFKNITKRLGKAKTVTKSLEKNYEKYYAACEEAKKKAPRHTCKLNNWVEYVGARKVIE